MSDEQFIEKYEELLNKGYCDCNEMNCLDNDVPTKILNIVKGTKLEAKQLLEENQELKKQLSNSHQIKAQQKEFIEWLEDKLNMCDGFLDTVKSDLEEISYAGRVSGKTYIATQIMKNETAMKCYEEVLSKYKETIGGNNDQ